LIQGSNICAEFLELLYSLGARYAILHDWNMLERGTISDLDIVLAADDLESVEECLCQRFRILTVLHYEASGFGFVLASRERDSEVPLIVDISTDYRWGGRIFFAGEELLQDRRRWRDSWIVGPREEFAYLLVKKIYEKGAVPEQQRLRLSQLARDLGAQAGSIVRGLFGESAGDQLLERILEEQWSEIQIRILELRSCLRSRVAKRDYLNPPRYWVGELKRSWVRWRYPTGLSIAVAGADQKTSALMSYLKDALPGVFRRSDIFQRLPHLTVPTESQGLRVARDSVRLPWIRLWQYVVEYNVHFWFRVRPLTIRSTLVIFGRDSSDLMVRSFADDWARSPRLSVARHLLPRPDLILAVLADVDLRSSVMKISDRAGNARHDGSRPRVRENACTIVLDGSLDSEHLGHLALQVVSKFLSQRYLERRRLWFGGFVF
jgi:hypothetical protein